MPGLARAQDAPRFASPTVPPDHWTMEAVCRLSALGLTTAGPGWGEQATTRRELALLFDEAARAAEVAAPERAPLVRDYLARFDEEFGATREAATSLPATGAARTGLHILGSRLTVGYDGVDGEVLAGIGYDNADDWTGTAPAATVATGLFGASVGVAVSPHAALLLEPGYREGGPVMERAELSLAWKALGLWVGRQPVGFGPGGIALGGGTALDGGGLRLLEPVRLPGWLGHLGPIRLHVLLSRVRNGDRIAEPWFWAARMSFAPHPRLQLGVNRAVMFGGEGNTAWTPRHLAYMLIGKHAGEAGEFDNQVLSVDVVYRQPLGAIPVLLFLESGMDDSAGAIKDVPGVAVGVYFPALPGIPSAALRITWTHFAAACCGNTIWYRNWAFRGGWTHDRRPLGHPLGGHGTEWRAALRAHPWNARLRLDLGAVRRVRGEENLFAPERIGTSHGAWLGMAGRPQPDVELFFDAAAERGTDGWTQHTVHTGARWFIR